MHGGRKLHLFANIAMIRITIDEPDLAEDTDTDYVEDELLSADPFNLTSPSAT